jgi:hypothetical protein
MSWEAYNRLEKTLRWKPRSRNLEDGMAVYYGPAPIRGSSGAEYWRFFWRGYALDAIVHVRKIKKARADRERRGWNGVHRKIATFLPIGTFSERHLDAEPWHYQKVPSKDE